MIASSKITGKARAHPSTDREAEGRGGGGRSSKRGMVREETASTSILTRHSRRTPTSTCHRNQQRPQQAVDNTSTRLLSHPETDDPQLYLADPESHNVMFTEYYHTHTLLE